MACGGQSANTKRSCRMLFEMLMIFALLESAFTPASFSWVTPDA